MVPLVEIEKLNSKLNCIADAKTGKFQNPDCKILDCTLDQADGINSNQS